MTDTSRWLDLLTDALDIDAPSGPVLSYAAPVDGSATDYFRGPRYPYPERISLRAYVEQKHTLQVELVKLQNWIKDRGLKMLLLFEGRDTAGKGSTIRTFMEHLNPRGARLVALTKPTDTERSQWYFQRYVSHLPSAGEIAFFDRSWYNRAGVERVMGFCTEAEYWEFVRQAPTFEQMLVDTGILLFKFYLSISKEEQALRLAERATNPLKQWKLSPVDVEAQGRWDAYTDAKEETFRLTDSSRAPWTIIKADDKLRGRLEAMRFVLSGIDYTGKSAEAVGTVDELLVANAGRIYPPR
ncbi:MAG: polyphosphate kinase 2 [Pseudomonadales bacterium]